MSRSQMGSEANGAGYLVLAQAWVTTRPAENLTGSAKDLGGKSVSTGSIMGLENRVEVYWK